MRPSSCRLSEMRSETSIDITLSQLLAQIQSRKWSLMGDHKPYSALRDESSNFDGIVLRGNQIVVSRCEKKSSEISARDPLESRQD